MCTMERYKKKSVEGRRRRQAQTIYVERIDFISYLPQSDVLLLFAFYSHLNVARIRTQYVSFAIDKKAFTF